MTISVFDLYTIGIGPSSSHTGGPMRASKNFVLELEKHKEMKKCQKIVVELFGSLALTGRGHGSDKAILLGLSGFTPEGIDPDRVDELVDSIKSCNKILLGGKVQIDFNFKEDLIFHRGKFLPEHPNGICIVAYDKDNKEIRKRVYFSIGGGFVLTREELNNPPKEEKLPLDFHTSAELLSLCKREECKISDLMYQNEKFWRSKKQINEGLQNIWKAMQDCVKRGYKQEGILPGGLKVKRRAPDIYKKLLERGESGLSDPLTILDWVNLYALSVNEENADGGKVVTAPTNGAAGIIPAVLHYLVRFCNGTDEQVNRFLLTAAAIAILYKKNASISGADVGCQGEVGVACSMAAGALTEVMGGTLEQVENAAEIAMEHNLGLTCDPVGGLVQVPCIERNAMGAVKAINASRMALRGDGKHFVSLDSVIKTMMQTGKEMNSNYKETSRGGLAVNIIEC